MKLKTVLLEFEDNIAIVTLNRPQALNAYDDQMQGELADVWRSLRANDNVWAVIVTGAGQKAFCAGRDVKELSQYQGAGSLVPRYDPASPTFGDRGAHLHKYDVMKPVIGAINGLVAGGGLQLVLSCDIRVMSETAWLADLHANVGQIGGVARIVKQLPYAIAAELLLAGGRLSAERAYQLGIVNQISSPDQLLDDAKVIARRICTLSPLAVKRSKEVMLSVIQHDAAATRLDEHYATSMRLTEDGKEGPRAHREKRKPVWTGK
jgi:enoyl-CoA hydratase/carnithine racemase